MIIDVVLLDKTGYIEILSQPSHQFTPFGKEGTLRSGLLGKFKDKLIAVEKMFNQDKRDLMSQVFNEMLLENPKIEHIEINWLYWKDIKDSLLDRK